MFHPKQSSLSALISRVPGKRIGQFTGKVLRHPLMAGVLIIIYLAAAYPEKSARIQSIISASDFPETALAALIFSGLLIGVIYGFIHFIRQIMTAFPPSE